MPKSVSRPVRRFKLNQKVSGRAASSKLSLGFNTEYPGAPEVGGQSLWLKKKNTEVCKHIQRLLCHMPNPQLTVRWFIPRTLQTSQDFTFIPATQPPSRSPAQRTAWCLALVWLQVKYFCGSQQRLCTRSRTLVESVRLCDAVSQTVPGVGYQGAEISGRVTM